MATVAVARQVILGVSPGLGTRLARKIFSRANLLDANVVIADQRGGTANARSLFALLSLGLRLGDPVSIQAEGPEADSACALVADLLEHDDGS